MLKVDRIHEDTQALPFVIFLQTRYEINLMNLSSHHMHETPGLVGILLVFLILIIPFRFIFLFKGQRKAFSRK